MRESAVWPYNIVPALRKRAAEQDHEVLLDLHPRIVDGVRELAGLEPGSERAARLVWLVDQFPTMGGGAFVPAGELLEAVGAEGE